MPFRPFRAYEDYYFPHVPETPPVSAPQKPGPSTFTEGGTLIPPPLAEGRFVPPGVGRGEQNRERFTPPPVNKPPVRAGSLSPFGETFRGETSLANVLSGPSIPGMKKSLFSDPGMFGLDTLFRREGMPGLDAFLLDALNSSADPQRLPNPDEIGIFLRKLLSRSERPEFRLKPSRLLGGRF